MKKLVKNENFTYDLYEVSGEDKQDFLKNFEKQINGIFTEFENVTKKLIDVKINSVGYRISHAYDGYTDLYLNISYSHLESDDDFKKRKEKVNKEKLEKEQKELEEYKRLKNKYENY